jgi:hypothetical protein
MKIANRFKFLVLTEGSSAIKQFTMSRTRLLAILGGVMASLMLLVVGMGLLVARFTESVEHKSLRRENNILMKELSELRFGVDALKASMVSLEQTDNLLRLMVDLPPINKDVRAVGVGGSISEEDSNPYDPAMDLTLDLDKLEREIKLQGDSFGQIKSRIVANQDLVAHTPSIWPVDGGRLSSYFGKRHDPYTGKIVPHLGVDISANRGTRVYAPADGVVIQSKPQYGLGKVVTIDHGYGFRTVYGHLNSIAVLPGQKVKRGDLIAFVGNTGRSTGPHLHYEVHVNGNPVNPLDFMFEGYASNK